MLRRSNARGRPTYYSASGTINAAATIDHDSENIVWICPFPRAGAVPYWAMRGIAGHVGHRPACDVLIDALRRTKSRHYDSGCVALVNGRGILKVRPARGTAGQPGSRADATDPSTLRCWLEESAASGARRPVDGQQPVTIF
jgi:hypothetical protein